MKPAFDAFPFLFVALPPCGQGLQRQIMHPLFSLIGGYMFAATVLRARENRPAIWYAVGAWAVGLIGLLWNTRTLDSNLLLSSVAFAGVSFLGVKFGQWLATKKK